MSRNATRPLPPIDVLPVAWAAVLTQHDQQRVDQVVISPDQVGPVLNQLLDWTRRYAPETYAELASALAPPAPVRPARRRAAAAI
ncbi:MAG TPA: hypothetical protein VGE07_25260 [Herpetosiphonaceae bacterium]